MHRSCHGNDVCNLSENWNGLSKEFVEVFHKICYMWACIWAFPSTSMNIYKYPNI